MHVPQLLLVALEAMVAVLVSPAFQADPNTQVEIKMRCHDTTFLFVPHNPHHDDFFG
jgi:hypothetical protein